jgi:hypothetical protein
MNIDTKTDAQMHKKMKAAISGLSVMASAYVPESLKQVLLDMAAEIDRLRVEVNQLRSQTDDGK